MCVTSVAAVGSLAPASDLDAGSGGDGGTFICRLPECVTRFTAGVWFILHRLFSRVCLVKPTSACVVTGDRFVVCQNFLGVAPELLNYLHQALVQYDAAITQDEVMVELVPMDLLLLPRVFAYLNDAHKTLGAVEVAAIRALLKLESVQVQTSGVAL